MLVPFSKYQATGNDFILIDNRFAQYILSTEQIARLCERRFGIGADGLVMLHNHPSGSYEMQYYNADGRLGSFCGNGSRAFVAFLNELGLLTSGKVNFFAYDGLHHAELLAASVRVQMQAPKNLEVLGPNEYFMDTGSPHHIIFVTKLIEYDVYQEGKKVRYAPQYPEGTNVDFVELQPYLNRIFVRTYERGVEAETLSCGTGVVASAIAAFLQQNPQSQIDSFSMNVHTLGGDLQVYVSPEKSIFLQGPTQKTFHGFVEV